MTARGTALVMSWHSSLSFRKTCEDAASRSIHIGRARACFAEPHGPQAIYPGDIFERRDMRPPRVLQARGIFRP